MPAVGDLLADRYRILGTIGAGGMATVHRAHDERLDRDVAIKVLLPNRAGDPNLAKRFEDEARTLAAAAHPGIVSVYDVDPGDPGSGQEPFFVMELCEGGSLADRLTGQPRLGPDDLVPILVSVAEGLADLHAHGIVHRDVKPSNILLATDRAKLADFGLARSDAAEPSDLTMPGTAVGTMAYLAPEVLAGQSATPAADVYALGIAAFTGLTGRFPRPASSLAELIGTARDPATRVSEASPDLGDSFDEPIAAVLAPEPAERPDALAFASSLTAALGRWRRNGPAIAAIPPAAGPGAADAEATTLAAFAVPSPADVADGAPTGDPGRGLRLAAVSALVVLAAVALGAIASSQLGTGSPPATIRPNASQIAGPSPTNRLSSTARPVATSTVADRALAALGEVDAAIGATTGKDGLKGNERNDLERLAGVVRSALQQGDLRAATRAANELAEKIDAAVKKLDQARAARLRDSAATLVAVLGASR